MIADGRYIVSVNSKTPDFSPHLRLLVATGSFFGCHLYFLKMSLMIFSATGF